MVDRSRDVVPIILGEIDNFGNANVRAARAAGLAQLDFRAAMTATPTAEEFPTRAFRIYENVATSFVTRPPVSEKQNIWSKLNDAQKRELVAGLVFRFRDGVYNNTKPDELDLTWRVDLMADLFAPHGFSYEPYAFLAVMRALPTDCRHGPPAIMAILSDLGVPEDDVKGVGGIAADGLGGHQWIEIRFSSRGKWEAYSPTAQRPMEPRLDAFQDRPVNRRAGSLRDELRGDYPVNQREYFPLKR